MNINLHILTKFLGFANIYFSKGVIRMKYVQKITDYCYLLCYWLLLPPHLPKKTCLFTATYNLPTAFAKKIYFALVVSRCSSCLCSHFFLLLTYFVKVLRMMLNGSQLTIPLDIISSITLYIGESHIDGLSINSIWTVDLFQVRKGHWEHIICSSRTSSKNMF